MLAACVVGPVVWIAVSIAAATWATRGPRDLIIDLHYLPATLELTGRLAHETDLRS